MEAVWELDAERVDIGNALGRVLAEEVMSDIDMPPFDQSTMDGYACRRHDLSNELCIIETIPAGQVPEKKLGRNECARIMTGAVVPSGADVVVKFEDTTVVSENTVRCVKQPGKSNIRCRATDSTAGDVVLSRGTIIRPRHIAVLATAGCINPLVVRRPKIGVIATGSELVDPGEKPPRAKIRNSNSFQLSAQAAAVGALPQNYGIVADTVELIDAAVKKAAAENDVVLLSGGVSKGDYDFVPHVLERNGARLLFERVGINPGRPAVFGVSDTTAFFGLAGNPVSNFVLFEIMVKPFLYRMMGHEFSPRTVPLPMAETITRKSVKRESIIPVRITTGMTVLPVEYHGSAHLHSLSSADGLISLPPDVGDIKQGTVVSVRLLTP